MPRKDKVGPELVALAGVVVDHVQDHLDAGRMQLSHRRLESRPSVPIRQNTPARARNKPSGVVAPVVALGPCSSRRRSSSEGVDRQQLDRGHSRAGADSR